jgi:hypothetical protein
MSYSYADTDEVNALLRHQVSHGAAHHRRSRQPPGALGYLNRIIGLLATASHVSAGPSRPPRLVCREKPVVIAVIELFWEAFADPPSMTTLASLAAEHELVLVCTPGATADDAMRRLRRTLGRHQMVALQVDDGVAHHERELVMELLDEGKVPSILTPNAPAAQPTDWHWLDVGATFALPDTAAAGQP